MGGLGALYLVFVYLVLWFWDHIVKKHIITDERLAFDCEIGAVATFVNRGLLGIKNHADTVNEQNTAYFPYKLGEDPNFYLNSTTGRNSVFASTTGSVKSGNTRDRRKEESCIMKNDRLRKFQSLNK